MAARAPSADDAGTATSWRCDVNETFRLGEVAGVRIGVNWSVLVIFVLVFVGLALGRFPALYPDRTLGIYLVAGGVAAIVFFLSLLAHEVAHAVVARREDVEVDGITLWMFGGVARLKGEAGDAGGELRIAAVGPLVSLALGAGFWLVALFLAQLGVDGIPVGVVSWLGIINLALAVFNLVPAAPLDGGRILRALLWRRRGDRVSAAITASRAGKVFGLVLVALGIVAIVTTPGIGGLWLAMIGWFIATAAAAEEQQAQVQRALGGLRVADVMSPDPMSVPRGTAIEDVLEDYVLRSRYSAFPVVDGQGRPTGLVTLNRLKQIDRRERAHVPVEEIACSSEDLAITRSATPLAELLTQMSGCADGRVLVVDEGRLVGIVSPTDLTRTLERAELLPDHGHQHI
jgi:Zn-dependent protease/predicted transcriptional regulator